MPDHVGLATAQTISNKTMNSPALIGVESPIVGATPDASLLNEVLVAANGGATTITNLLNGFSGQIARIRGDGNTTIAHNANIKLKSGANVLVGAEEIVSLEQREISPGVFVWYEIEGQSTLPPTVGTSYHISAAGNDSNDGSIGSPWLTINNVYTKASGGGTFFQPGDKILLRAGDTFEGSMILGESGNPSFQITIDRYGAGADPIIQGDHETSAVYNAIAGKPGVYSVTTGDGTIFGEVYNGSTKWNRIPTDPDGGGPLPAFDLGDPQGLSDYLDTFTQGSWGPKSIGSVHYIRTEDDGAPPAGLRLYADAGISISSYTTVQNIEVTKCDQGILMPQVPGNKVVIQNNYIHDCINKAIFIRGGDTGDHLGPRIDDVTIQNNTTFNTGNNGVYVQSVDNYLIKGNDIDTVGGTVNGIPVTTGDRAGIGLEESSFGIVENNDIANTVHAAVDFELEEDTIVRYNYAFSTETGISVHGTNIQVYGNVFALNENGNGGQQANTGGGYVYIHNNVFWGCTQFGLGGGSGITFRNNIIGGTERGSNDTYLMDFTGATLADSDYNCFFSFGSSTRWKWQTNVYLSLAAYQADTGLDANSVYVDPVFAVVPPVIDSDFELDALSTLIDAGVDFNSWPFNGTAPDIGAKESP